MFNTVDLIDSSAKSFPPFTASIPHPLSDLPHHPPAMSAAASTAPAVLSTAQITELVNTVDTLLRQALADGRCHEETIKHRTQIVRSASRRVVSSSTHAHTNLLQATILSHPEYDTLRRTHPAYLWGYCSRFRDARVAKKLTPEFFATEREHLADFDARSKSRKNVQPSASSSRRDELSGPLRRMSLQPDIPHATTSAGRVLPRPAIEAIQEEEPTRRFTDIEDEPEDAYMPDEPQGGPSKRKYEEEEETRMDVDNADHGGEKSTKEAKRRRTGEPSGEPHDGSNPAARPPPIPTDVVVNPPCDRCRKKGLHCVEQLSPPEELDAKGKKKRTACYECAKTRNGCNHDGQGARTGRKRKTAAIVENSEEDELDGGESPIPLFRAVLKG